MFLYLASNTHTRSEARVNALRASSCISFHYRLLPLDESDITTVKNAATLKTLKTLGYTTLLGVPPFKCSLTMLLKTLESPGYTTLMGVPPKV